MGNPLRAAAVLNQRARQTSASAYAGAAINRLTQDWVTASSRSADQDVRSGHGRLVARSREMCRNDANAKRFLGLVHQNIIGPRGIRFQSRIRTPDGKSFDRELNRRVEEAWAEWTAPENASADGRLSFTDIERMIARGTPRDGESLVRFLPGFDNPFGFALQVLDPDVLDITHERAPARGQTEIRGGVELDGWGRRIAYHVYDGHPSEHLGRQGSRIPLRADQVAHLYIPERVGQTRGVPWFAAAMIATRMLDGYREAELVAARISASKMGFFTPDENAPVPDPNSNAGAVEDFGMEAEPGKFGMTPYGYKFDAWDPQHPNSAYEAFEKAILRHIAAGLEVSYSSLTGDLSDVNYSSIRAGLLAERDVWRALQFWMIEHFHRRVFRAWLPWAITTGRLDVPMSEARRLGAHEWQPRGWDWVDPQKDVEASIMARRAGLDSLTRIAASQGRDVEEIFREIQREEELAEEFGLELDLDTRSRGPAPTNGSAEGWGGRLEAITAEPLNGNGNGNGRKHL